MAKNNLDFDSIDCGVDDSGDLDERGTRVYSRDGSEHGVSLGACGVYAGRAGRSTIIRVLWPDGEVTRCKCRGILLKDGRWKIS